MISSPLCGVYTEYTNGNLLIGQLGDKQRYIDRWIAGDAVSCVWGLLRLAPTRRMLASSPAKFSAYVNVTDGKMVA